MSQSEVYASTLAEQQVLDLRADDLMLSMGRGVVQGMVDTIVAALRQGDEAAAVRQHQLLSTILRKQASAG